MTNEENSKCKSSYYNMIFMVSVVYGLNSICIFFWYLSTRLFCKLVALFIMFIGYWTTLSVVLSERERERVNDFLICYFFSSMLSMDPLIGAIAAGNVVVSKPSEVAPATSSLLASLIQ